MIKLENVTVRGGRKILLDNINADFSEGGCWVIAGINGSGKSVLGKVMAGLLRPEKGSISGHAKTGYSSFELQDRILEAERRKDESRLMHGAVDEGTKVGKWLSLESCSDTEYAEELISMFRVERIIDRGLKFLSTGEFRKVILLSALLDKPDLLVIDDPFDGLDAFSRESLKKVISLLAEKKQKIILITNRIEDIFPECTHMLLLSEGRAEFSGPVGKGLEFFRDDRKREGGLSKSASIPESAEEDEAAGGSGSDVLVRMKDVTVTYGDVRVLDRISWEVFRGDKWKITGVNGSGKSTLLSLVNGDNPQAYANDITLFGKKRGSGESVWEIKKRIGFVSGGFQLDYRVRCTVLDTVLSGLYDSVGLYADINTSDIEKGEKWLEITSLADKKGKLFRELSYGEMRMVLIARAMIKNPELLILDEPCQGLDDFNRDRVLSLCEKIGSKKNRTILFVTHDSGVDLSCFTHYLKLEKGKNK